MVQFQSRTRRQRGGRVRRCLGHAFIVLLTSFIVSCIHQTLNEDLYPLDNNGTPPDNVTKKSTSKLIQPESIYGKKKTTTSSAEKSNDVKPIVKDRIEISRKEEISKKNKKTGRPSSDNLYLSVTKDNDDRNSEQQVGNGEDSNLQQAMKLKNNSSKSKEDETIELSKSEHSELKDDNPKDESTESKKREPMNIVVLYPDDWRHNSVGYSNSAVRTPFLDEFTKEGITFTQSAVTTSVCWMSRATLFTGQYASRHESVRLECPRFVEKGRWERTWPHKLQENDYFVGHVGKWNFWNSKPGPEKLFNWTDIHESDHWFEDENGDLIPASEYSKRAAHKFLDERPKDKPFAMTVAFFPPKGIDGYSTPGGQYFPTNETRKLYDNDIIVEPEMESSLKHLPIFLQNKDTVARERWFLRYRSKLHYQESMKNMYALITGVDQACKEIVEKLKEDGLYNNTMIIFTTDNGLFHGEHGLAGKWYPYQESIRVPMIVYDPRMPAEKVGTEDESFTLNIDLAETILAAAGVKPDESMQGRDISDLYLKENKIDSNHATAFVGIDPWREEFFYEYPNSQPEIIPSSTALVRKDWKYIHWPEFKYEQLFDLKTDPLEMNDIFNNQSTKNILVEMRERHKELRNKIQDIGKPILCFQQDNEEEEEEEEEEEKEDVLEEKEDEKTEQLQQDR